jgi:phage gp36-like protein
MLTLSELNDRLYGDVKDRADPNIKTTELDRANEEAEEALKRAGYPSELFEDPIPSPYFIPSSLMGRVFDIVNYRLHVRLEYIHDGARDHPLYVDYSNALKWLESVASGKIELDVGDPDTSDDITSGAVVYTTPSRGW